jgi:hypothetical protein
MSGLGGVEPFQFLILGLMPVADPGQNILA